MKWFNPAMLLLAISSSVLPAQSFYPQELTVVPIAMGLTHSGGLAIDGVGNAWIVGVSGTNVLPSGFLTRVTPAGMVTVLAVTGLFEIGDLTRGNDGSIWFWMNVGSTSSLCSVTPGGVFSSVVTLAGGMASGIAQDAAGNFYLGQKPPATGIQILPPGGSTLGVFAAGLAEGNRHLSIPDPTASNIVLRVASQYRAGQTSFGTPTTMFLDSPTVACGSCSSQLMDIATDWFGNLLVLQRTQAVNGGMGLAGTQVIDVSGPGVLATIADLGPVSSAHPPGIARGINGDYWLVDGGVLHHVSGTPAIATFGYPGNGTMQLMVDAPAGEPLIVAFDQPGIVLPMPPYGTLHTSLGFSGSFYVLEDGFGIFFLPPHPNGMAPWALTLPAPIVPLQLSLTVEAYSFSNAARNGLARISNAINVEL